MALLHVVGSGLRDVIIEWLKEAGARAFELESPDRPGGRLLVDLVVSGGIVVIPIRRAGEQAFDCVTWSELERAEAKVTPLICLIDEVVADIGKRL